MHALQKKCNFLNFYLFNISSLLRLNMQENFFVILKNDYSFSVNSRNNLVIQVLFKIIRKYYITFWNGNSLWGRRYQNITERLAICRTFVLQSGQVSGQSIQPSLQIVAMGDDAVHTCVQDSTGRGKAAYTYSNAIRII